MEIVLPKPIELIQHVLDTSIHSCHIHYYLEKQGERPKDPQLPHDVEGEHNKLAWEVARRMALQYRNDGKDYKDIIMEGVTIHRKQYHHLMWADSSSNVPKDSRILSSADALCSMLEPLESRKYQGGMHTWEQIEDIIAEKDQENHQTYWMKKGFQAMEKIPQPNLKGITCFAQIPKDQISSEMYDAIIGRGRQALCEYELDHGIKIYKNSESIIREILK